MPDSQTATGLLCMEHGPQPDICPRCAAERSAEPLVRAAKAVIDHAVRGRTTWSQVPQPMVDVLAAAVAEFEKGGA